MTKSNNTTKPAPQSQPKEVEAPKVNKKQAILALLKRSEGVTIAELEKVTSWKQPSVRGSLVNLKNKDKHNIISEKTAGVRRYFIKPVDTEVKNA